MTQIEFVWKNDNHERNKVSIQIEDVDVQLWPDLDVEIPTRQHIYRMTKGDVWFVYQTDNRSYRGHDETGDVEVAQKDALALMQETFARLMTAFNIDKERPFAWVIERM